MSRQDKDLISKNSDFWFKSELIHPQVEDELLVMKNHQKLIDSASELFGKNGYHTTTIRQIVKQSGIGIGSIYQYVKNKEEILVLILEYILKQYEYKLNQSIEDAHQPIDKLIKGIEMYYRIINEEDEKIILGYSSTISLSRSYRGFIKELELRTNQIFERILAEGVQKGQFKPINIPLVAFDIIMLGHMWALKRSYFKNLLTIDEYVNQQTKHILEIVLENDYISAIKNKYSLS
jgi:AcrR family transcriptional regulator